MRRIIPLGFILSTLLSSTPAQAHLYNFTAIVVEAWGQPYVSGASPLPSAAQESVTGYFDTRVYYDETTASILPWPNSWEAHLDIHIGFGPFSIDTSGPSGEIISVYNNKNSNGPDIISYHDSQPNHNGYNGGAYVDEFSWIFTDTTSYALNTEDLPLSINPYAFDQITFGIENTFYSDSWWNGEISYLVTSITPVPEPATIFLFATGCTLLIGYRQKNLALRSPR